MRERDEVIVERFLADLHELFPQTRGVIAGATVHRWELGNVYARPGRGRLQAALEGALGTPPEPAPGRRLLRRAGEHGGRRPDRARGRRTRRRPNPRGDPCLSRSTESCPRSSRRSPTTATRSTRRALAAIVDRLVGAGVGGLVPGGSTGEFTTLTNAERRRARRGHRRGGGRPRPRRRRHGRALDARDRRAERARRAGRRRRGDDRPAVLRRALVARAARALHGGRGRDRDPDHVLQPAERVGGHAHRRAAPASSRSPASRTPAATPSPPPS